MNRKDLPTRQTETDQDAPDASRPIYIMVDHAPNPMTETNPMTGTNPIPPGADQCSTIYIYIMVSRQKKAWSVPCFNLSFLSQNINRTP